VNRIESYIGDDALCLFIQGCGGDINPLLLERTAGSDEDFQLVPQTGNLLAKEVEQVLDEIPNNPFTDEPLKYRRTKNGYIVYSVGQDLVDDGGKGDDIVGRRPFPEPNPLKPKS
jgi:Txe/YoeB family toxin of Txe-Axe toxin-antitoxin module